ncbi:MAG: hypothetical protein AAFR72_06940 [Pseudomonadota bacterium]
MSLRSSVFNRVYWLARGTLATAFMGIILAALFWIPFGAILLLVLGAARYGLIGSPASGGVMLVLLALGAIGSAALIVWRTPLRDSFNRFTGMRSLTKSPASWRTGLVMAGQAALILITANALGTASLPLGGDLPDTALMDRYFALLDGVFGPPKVG